jgi:hypothetical protein
MLMVSRTNCWPEICFSLIKFKLFNSYFSPQISWEPETAFTTLHFNCNLQVDLNKLECVCSLRLFQPSLMFVVKTTNLKGASLR